MKQKKKDLGALKTSLTSFGISTFLAVNTFCITMSASTLTSAVKTGMNDIYTGLLSIMALAGAVAVLICALLAFFATDPQSSAKYKTWMFNIIKWYAIAMFVGLIFKTIRDLATTAGTPDINSL